MTKWTKEYDNDTGPCDDYFQEWWNVTDGNHIYRCKNSDDADFLIAALAQPEPVAWINKHGACMSALFKEADATAGEYTIPLYITPPQRKPLTEDEEFSNGFALALHDAVLIRIGKDDEPTRQAIARIDKLVSKYKDEAAHGIKEDK